MFALQMAGAGLENQTCAGMNVQLNVCYNKKLSYNVVVGRCKPMPNQLMKKCPHIIADTE